MVVDVTSTTGDCAADGDRLLQRRDFHVGVDRRRESEADDDALADDRAEAAELVGELVGARAAPPGSGSSPSSPVTVGAGALHRLADRGDGDAGQRRPLSSVALPLIAPVVELTVWAHAPVTLTSASNTPTATTFTRLMVPPPSQVKLV